MKKVKNNQTYKIEWLPNKPLMKGREINRCIEKAWADLYYGVDESTIDPIEAESKMQELTQAYILRQAIVNQARNRTVAEVA